MARMGGAPPLLLLVLVAAMVSPLALAQTAGQTPANTLAMKVTVIPSAIPADGRTHDAVFVQLASRSGQIVAAPETYQVFLTSANLSVASVQSLLVIQKGLTYGVATLTSTQRQGQTNVTLAATGLSPASVLVTTYPVSNQSSRLVAFIGPPVLFADGISNYYFFVQLQDSNGMPATSSRALSIAVTSSSQAVASLPPTLVLPQGRSDASVQFQASSMNGSTTITAQLNDLFSSSRTVQTSYLPLSVSLAASSPQGFTGSDLGLTATALSAGVPLAGATVAWSVDHAADTFSNGTLTTDANGTAAASLHLSQAGNTTITATVSAPGYSSRSASIVVAVADRPLVVNLIADSIQVNASQPVGLTALVTWGGKAFSGAQVTWHSSIGTVSPPTSTTGASGSARAIFLSPLEGNATLVVQVTAPGYSGGSAVAVITVGSLSGAARSALGSVLGFIPGPSFFGVPLLLVAIVILIVIVVFVRRRRRAGGVAEAEEGKAEVVAESAGLEAEDE